MCGGGEAGKGRRVAGGGLDSRRLLCVLSAATDASAVSSLISLIALSASARGKSASRACLSDAPKSHGAKPSVSPTAPSPSSRTVYTSHL